MNTQISSQNHSSQCQCYHHPQSSKFQISSSRDTSPNKLTSNFCLNQTQHNLGPSQRSSDFIVPSSSSHILRGSEILASPGKCLFGNSSEIRNSNQGHRPNFQHRPINLLESPKNPSMMNLTPTGSPFKVFCSKNLSPLFSINSPNIHQFGAHGKELFNSPDIGGGFRYKSPISGFQLKSRSVSQEIANEKRSFNSRQLLFESPSVSPLRKMRDISNEQHGEFKCPAYKKSPSFGDANFVTSRYSKTMFRQSAPSFSETSPQKENNDPDIEKVGDIYNARPHSHSHSNSHSYCHSGCLYPNENENQIRNTHGNDPEHGEEIMEDGNMPPTQIHLETIQKENSKFGSQSYKITNINTFSSNCNRDPFNHQHTQQNNCRNNQWQTPSPKNRKTDQNPPIYQRSSSSENMTSANKEECQMEDDISLTTPTPKKRNYSNFIKFLDNKNDKYKLVEEKMKYYTSYSSEVKTVRIEKIDQRKKVRKINPDSESPFQTPNDRILIKPINSFSSHKLFKFHNLQNDRLSYFNEGNQTPSRKKCCNCKNSNCLKLYCVCFAEGKMCKGCNCINCYNNEAHMDLRNIARSNTLGKNPNAFKPKIGKVVVSAASNGKELRHTRGCHCRKSGCLKKYCECYQSGVPCTELCKCEGCQNCEGRDSHSGNLKRKFKNIKISPFEENVYESSHKESQQGKNGKFLNALNQVARRESTSHFRKRSSEKRKSERKPLIPKDFYLECQETLNCNSKKSSNHPKSKGENAKSKMEPGNICTPLRTSNRKPKKRIPLEL